jgi:G6PDH family F420-dependent oxidoreductase
MLAEAVELMRELWKGDTVDHDGEHYVVENARIYTIASYPIQVLVSAFGPQALQVAARIGDGFITTSPSAEDIATYRKQGGKGITQAGVKVRWNEDKQQAVKIAHKTWRNSFVPGQLVQDLPTPTHFDQRASSPPRRSWRRR